MGSGGLTVVELSLNVRLMNREVFILLCSSLSFAPRIMLAMAGLWVGAVVIVGLGSGAVAMAGLGFGAVAMVVRGVAEEWSCSPAGLIL